MPHSPSTIPPPSLQPTIYGGSAVPGGYNQYWQYFTNLTPAQVAQFQSMAEWHNFLAYVALHPTTAFVGMSPAAVSTALAAL